LSDRTRSKSNAAVYYIPDGYTTGGKNIMGIHAASEGFMHGFARHAEIDIAYCAVDDDSAAVAFHNVFQKIGRRMPIKAFPLPRIEHLTDPGCLYLPGPGLNDYAWRRRQGDQRAFSLCGVTHTTATDIIMDALVDFAVAPVQSWDAVICTSRAVHGTVTTILADQAAYLRDRLGAATTVAPQLPVIPLGVDCDAFGADDAKRAAWRERLGIAEDDIAILFLGRLAFHAKAHPIPMYQALAKTAETCGRRLHLIQAGWFPNDKDAAHYRKAGQDICPRVNLIFLDGLDPEVRTTIWTAADIFTSLTDNIQETFGLTPVEAMAAGLPVVVSNWNGYRDTVRDGIDGFLIPTVMAPAPLGGDLAFQYGSNGMNYDTYIGQTAQFIAVDIAAAAAAYARLASDDGLRREMSLAGRRRAREVYDWKTVIGAYQELWSELGAIRQTAPESAPHSGLHTPRPARPDPFHAFAQYPSITLQMTDRISRTDMTNETFEALKTSPLILFAGVSVPSTEECVAILAMIEHGPRTALEITAKFPPNRQAVVFRGLVWLNKFGLVTIAPGA
jgi:glycosyltransferase involved in cell wall biosynthesis